MTIDRRGHRGGRTVLALSGTFGPGEARELHALLAELAGVGHVTVDFHEVRLFDDHAVAALGRELARHGRRVELVGLSEHHHRLMAYMAGA